MIKIVIPGKPIAKKRPRFARRGGFVQTYDSQKKDSLNIIEAIKKQVCGKINGPIVVNTFFFMPRPKSHFGTGKNYRKLKESAPLHHTNKPDIDNLQKMIYDCLNHVLWHDDSCVVESYAKKAYSENPRTEIKILGADHENWEGA